MQNIDEYQNESNLQRLYATRIDHPIVGPALGLSGEVGEFHDKIKKIFRDKDGQITEDDKRALKLELGDIMWYVVVCAETLGFKMSDILDMNLQKLQSRRQRNQVKGDGDDR